MLVMVKILCSACAVSCGIGRLWHPRNRKMADFDDSSSFEMVDSPAGGDVLEAGDNDIPSEPCDQTSAQQHDHFWQVEEWARLLNAALTPVEKNALMGVNLPERLQLDARTVVQNFGKNVGAGAPCRRVLEHLVTAEVWLKEGDKIQITSNMFPLIKHLVVAERSGHKLVEGPTTIGCSCFSETYLMPLGCPHKRLKIFKDIYLPHTLCHHCSLCLRCHKFLGLTVNMQLLMWDCHSVLASMTA